MKWLDFLFWHYYCYFEQNKKRYRGNNVWGSVLTLSYTCFWVFGTILGIVGVFVYDINMDYGPMKMWAWAIGIPWILYLDYRYERKKSIVQNKYQIFRERGGEPDKVSKKNLKILLWYTLITTVGLLLVAIVMGTLNKHGYFEGCRLFP